jgi:hypothetical protein
MYNLEVVSNKNAFGDDEFCMGPIRVRTTKGRRVNARRRKRLVNLQGTETNLSTCAGLGRRQRAMSGHTRM